MRAPVPPSYRLYVVGVFNIVGQSGVFQNFTGLPAEGAGADELKAAVTETLGFAQWFRPALKKLFDETPFEKNPLAPYDRDLHKIETLLAETEVKTQAFADFVVSYAAMFETDHQLRALSAMYRTLFMAGTLMVWSLAHGRVLRVGLEVEGGVERLPGEIYGRALDDALTLEAQAAYPRIVIGRSFYAYLTKLRQNPENSVFGKHRLAFVEKCLGLITQDTDGRLILHYLGEAFKALSPTLTPELFAKARQVIADHQAAWAAAGHTAQAAEFARLQTYWK